MHGCTDVLQAMQKIRSHAAKLHERQRTIWLAGGVTVL
jgi:hypothetical protein